MSYRYQLFISVIGISILLVIPLLFPFDWLATGETSNDISEASKWNRSKAEQFSTKSFQYQQEPSQVSAIKGQVTDEQGHPLSGYVVEAISFEDGDIYLGLLTKWEVSQYDIFVH